MVAVSLVVEIDVRMWARLDACAAKRQEEGSQRPGDRAWNEQRMLLGLAGEHAYAELTGLPFDPDHALLDGGEDFPGVDVKAVRFWNDPLLKRLVTDPLKAPAYALMAVDVPGRRVRYCGWATRQMIVAAPVREFGYGPTRTLSESDHELLDGFPP